MSLNGKNTSHFTILNHNTLYHLNIEPESSKKLEIIKAGSGAVYHFYDQFCGAAMPNM